MRALGMMVVCGAMAMSAGAMGAVVWSQLPESIPGSATGGGSILDQVHLADDFTLTEATTLSSIRWWGSVSIFGNNLTPLTGFKVQLLDASGVDNGPGVVLRDWMLPLSSVGQTETGLTLGFWPEVRYDFDLPETFAAAAGTRYWLFVAGVLNGPQASWNWRTSLMGNGSTSIAIAFGPDWLTYTQSIADWAFELRSVPGVGTGATVACAMMAVGRRRIRYRS